jgi:hypothetical protein
VGAFADAVDALLYDNARFTAAAAVVFAAHVLVAVTAIARRRIAPLTPGLNLAVAGTSLLYKASQYAGYPALIDIARDHPASSTDVRFVLFEALVAVIAGLALAGWRFAVWLSAAALLVHALGFAALLAFALTYSPGRLF